jgi:hypothetical protein
MAGMALWSDGKIENEESYFLYKLAEMIKIPDAFVTEVLKVQMHLSNIKVKFLNYSNPVKHFMIKRLKV